MLERTKSSRLHIGIPILVYLLSNLIQIKACINSDLSSLFITPHKKPWGNELKFNTSMELSPPFVLLIFYPWHFLERLECVFHAANTLAC